MTPETDNVGAAILKGVCNPEAEDLAIELGEFELDSFLDEGLLNEIPMIKSVIACRKTWTAIQDRLFLRKVAGFLLACPQFGADEKAKFLDECLRDPKKAKRLSDCLVLILNRLDDFDKPSMLAKAFAALVRYEIDLVIFRRLASAIDIGFLEDLKEFTMLSSSIDPEPRRLDPQLRALYVNLQRTGLAGPKRTTGITPITGISFEVTELGQIFKKCMNKASAQI
jgi:hypothetical protein